MQLVTGPGKDEHESWSTDGSRLAFMSDRDGNWEIYVMKRTGPDRRD